ncbi:hypothetical protein DD748_08030 [Helicobacter pylori]|nr:hypothetical protein DD748_08030 [Helicobacter pylori]
MFDPAIVSGANDFSNDCFYHGSSNLLRGYEPVKGPEILKSDVWKISGHYDNYKDTPPIRLAR